MSVVPASHIAIAARQPGCPAPANLNPAPSLAHQRRQDATVAALEATCAAAERFLAAHPEAIERGAMDLLCPCRIPRRQCRCEMQRAKT